MNSYAQITETFITRAKNDDNVRAVIQIGSRARSVEPADEWSDLDLVIVAQDITVYTQTTEWIHACGTPLLMFIEHAFDGSVERRVLFEGLLDVDFVFDTPKSFTHGLELEAVRKIFQRGYRVLLDKDAWQTLLNEHCNIPPTPHNISNEEILNEIHDYWYHCVWMTKKLRRGELWTAMNCLNCYMRRKLLRMIEISASRVESVDTWHNGRFLEKWADSSIVQRLQGCFGEYDVWSLTAALHCQIALYHDLASEVAMRRNLTYPTEARQQIIEWLTSLAPAPRH